MDSLGRFYRNGFYTFKGLYGFLDKKAYFLVKVINPIMMVIFYSLVATHTYGAGNITPWVIGNSLILSSFNAFFGVGSVLISERSYGTLKSLVTAPANLLSCLMGKISFHMVDGLVTVLIGLLTGYGLFHLRFSLSSLPSLLVILLSAMFSVCAMGIFVGCMGLVTRDINLLLNLSSMLLMALSGVNYPIERLPIALQKLSLLVPLTRALKAARLLMDRQTVPWSLLGGEVLLGFLYAVGGYFFLKVMEGISRKRGTLDFY